MRWKKITDVLQIGFTYIGTIVGAGFASGQEILQFFTRFGGAASLTIALSCFLFIWLGTKLMLLAHTIGARSYEDLNIYVFGNRVGRWVSLFTLVILFAITTVMLAGAGTIFREQLHLSYQFGLITTLVLAYFVITKGIRAILAVNTVVVPIMMVFTCLVVAVTLHSPDVWNWVRLPGHSPLLKVWISPFMYAALNLSLAQSVLVPIGSSIRDRRVIRYGGIVGGVGIGLMLFAGHFALSAGMPGISRFEIPMAHMIERLGITVQLLFALVIFAEIFTTLIANVYGLTLQLRQRTSLSANTIIFGQLILCFLISQFGFKGLLSALYPLFGLISMVWFGMMIRSRSIT